MSSDVEDFFVGAVRDTIDYRVKNEVKRNDFLQLLIQLMNKGFIEDVDTVTTVSGERKFNKNSWCWKCAPCG